MSAQNDTAAPVPEGAKAVRKPGPPEKPQERKRPAQTEESKEPDEPEASKQLPPVIYELRRPLLLAALPLLVMAFALLLRYPLWNTGWPRDGVGDYFAAAAMQSADGRLNINTADLPALCTLPGIGEVKARAILAYRQEHGPFTELEQLLEVSGIGEKTLEDLRDLLFVGPPSEDPEIQKTQTEED